MSEPEQSAETGEPKKKLAGKTLVLFIALPALLVIGGGGAAAMMLLGGGEKAAHSEEHGGKDEKKKPDDAHAKGDHGGGDKEGAEKGGHGVTVSGGEGVTYVGLPELLVNMATDDGRPALLKLKVTIETANQEVVEAIEPRLPRILDQFQGFLRELRIDDISGSAGSTRLRLELLRRVNLAIAPAEAGAVLIEEMLVQ
jgi:flagellar FliL protein